MAPPKEEKEDKTMAEDPTTRCAFCYRQRIDYAWHPIFRFNMCKHYLRVCRKCLIRNINHSSTIHGNSTYCIGAGCNKEINWEDLRMLVGMTRLKVADVLQRLGNPPDGPVNDDFKEQDFIICQRCGSGQIHSGCPIVTCHNCKKRSCANHRGPWHKGLSCAEYDRLRELIPQNRCTSWQVFLHLFSKWTPEHLISPLEDSPEQSAVNGNGVNGDSPNKNNINKEPNSNLASASETGDESGKRSNLDSDPKETHPSNEDSNSTSYPVVFHSNTPELSHSPTSQSEQSGPHTPHSKLALPIMGENPNTASSLSTLPSKPKRRFPFFATMKQRLEDRCHRKTLGAQSHASDSNPQLVNDKASSAAASASAVSASSVPSWKVRMAKLFTPEEQKRYGPPRGSGKKRASSPVPEPKDAPEPENASATSAASITATSGKEIRPGRIAMMKLRDRGMLVGGWWKVRKEWKNLRMHEALVERIRKPPVVAN